MFYLQSYRNRATRQQEQRRKKRNASSTIMYNTEVYDITSDDDDDNIDVTDSTMNTTNDNLINSCEVTSSRPDDAPHIHYSTQYAEARESDHDDIDLNENLISFSSDSNLPLYKNSHLSVKAAVNIILCMAFEFNFPKSVLERILKVFKEVLPSPNLLPTTHVSIMKTIGGTPTSSSKYYCNSCFTLCTTRSGQKFCTNDNCILNKNALSTRNVSEIVTLDIKEQLRSIIARNMFLFNKKEFFQSYDIPSGLHYKSNLLPDESNKILNDEIHPITLNIHTDGAPLVRTTKSSLWPCLASLVELPSHVREKQANIVILCLWTSSIKPNVNIFMNDCIQQLQELSTPFILIVNNLRFLVHVRTQLFLSDLPAKALFWKTINYNGYNACANCFSEGTYKNRQVLYPYNKNNYRQRTHAEFLTTARAVENRKVHSNKSGSIDGVKGKSPLLDIFEYPKQIILDYMHLCCLGHMSNLIQRWLTMLSVEALTDINMKISSQRFPHNMSVKFNYPLNLCTEWKAKHFRAFVLSIGVPCMLSHLPSLVISHFALYSMFVKLLHCPQSDDEIKLADKIIHYYCRVSPQVYDETIELFSLHAHLHLPQQVLIHGGLCFTSAFCFESAIHYLKKKAHGTRNLATQIADWIHIAAAAMKLPFQIPPSTATNNIDLNHTMFDTYRYEFLNVLRTLVEDESEIKLYLRYKNKFTTYHTVLYDSSFNCSSFIISYKSSNSSTQHGQIIIFFKYNEDYYAYVQQYAATKKNINDYTSVPEELKDKLNEIFPMKTLSQSYVVVPVNDICHKCIEVKHDDFVILSELRVDYEHD